MLSEVYLEELEGQLAPAIFGENGDVNSAKKELRKFLDKKCYKTITVCGCSMYIFDVPGKYANGKLILQNRKCLENMRPDESTEKARNYQEFLNKLAMDHNVLGSWPLDEEILDYVIQGAQLAGEAAER